MRSSKMERVSRAYECQSVRHRLFLRQAVDANI